MGHHISLRRCSYLFLVLLSTCGTNTIEFPASFPSGKYTSIQYANQVTIIYEGANVSDQDSDQWYYIKTTFNDLVIDASEPKEMKLQPTNGKAEQLWKFVPAGRPGVYYVVNKNTRTVLDVVSGIPEVVRVNEKQNSDSQKWIVSYNGHIYNVGKKKCIDVREGRMIPNNFLQVWDPLNLPAQNFTLVEKMN